MATDRPDSSATLRPPWELPLVAAILVCAGGLRLAACGGDLVFDEVWSWNIVRTNDSAWQIPFRAIDNNHILNTWIMQALGLLAPMFAYRLPAACAGTLAVWFGHLVARRAGPLAGVFVPALLAFSHPLIVYGTEARGYGYLACCTLGAWWALETFCERRRWWLALVFGLWASLGFLSHLTFLFAYAGFGAASLWHLVVRRRDWRNFLLLHALPGLTLLFLWVAYISSLTIGGGAQNPLGTVLISTLSLAAGGPEHGPWTLPTATLSAALLVLALISQFRRPPAPLPSSSLKPKASSLPASSLPIRGVFFLVTMVLTPAAVLFSSWNQHQVVYPRYFLVPLLFGCVAVGEWLAVVACRRGLVRCAVPVLLTAFVFCNLAPVARLIRAGRGEYTAAVRWLAEHADGPRTTLATDHDFRNYYLIEYFWQREQALFQARGCQLSYVKREEFPPTGTDWYLRHSFPGDPLPPEEFAVSPTVTYHLAHRFPSHSLTAWTWSLYRKR